jgi:hypothetical protein
MSLPTYAYFLGKERLLHQEEQAVRRIVESAIQGGYGCVLISKQFNRSALISAV